MPQASIQFDTPQTSAHFLVKQLSAADIEFVVPLSYSLAQSLPERIQFGIRSSRLSLSARARKPLHTHNMILGTEWVIEAVDCNPAILTDLGRIRAVFDRVISDLNLHVEGEVAWHQFSLPDGISGLALLSESHLACHTYPEFRAATFNLYCCRSRDSWPWETMLKEMLGATGVTIRILHRMIKEGEPTTEELVASRAG